MTQSALQADGFGFLGQFHDGFDDFLGLRHADLSTTRLVVFSGVSGSGKSSYMEFLTHVHADYARLDAFYINPGQYGGMILPGTDRLLCADDIMTWAEFMAVLAFVRRGGRAVMTSHLPVWLLQGIGLFAPMRVYCTDRDVNKLQRWLTRRGIQWSPATMAAYVARYRASYTDMRLILAHMGENRDFDRAYHDFHRFCRITPTPLRG